MMSVKIILHDENTWKIEFSSAMSSLFINLNSRFMKKEDTAEQLELS